MKESLEKISMIPTKDVIDLAYFYKIDILNNKL